MQKLKSKTIVFCLCAVFVISAVVGVLLNIGAVTVPKTEAAVGSSDLEDVTGGGYDLSDIRQQNYDKSLVTEKPAELTGKGSVIVKLDGGDLYDYYNNADNGIEFSDYIASPNGKRRADEMKARQDSILKAMDKAGIEYEFKYSYTALTNAFSVKVDYSDVSRIEKLSGVESVYYSNHYAVPEVDVTTNNANVYATGIYNTEGVDYNGAGMVVAVLDTGLDYTHNAFRNMPVNKEGIWDLDYINEKLGDTIAKKSRMPSATASDVYINEKVPFAFDYADDDCNVYPSYSTHGTHVAGIIAGRDDDKIFGEGDEAKSFIGVAPEAQLVIMKVFTDDLDSKMLGGADSDDILAAVHDCAVLGVDVINMSLGSSGGFSSDATDAFLSEVYETVGELGISLIVAASNDSSSGYGGGNGMNLSTNPDSGTVGSPSTYSSALSVASINGKRSPYFIANQGKSGKESVAFVVNAADINSNDIEFVDDIIEKYSADEWKNDSTIWDENGNLTLNYVVVSGVGRSAQYNSTVRRALADGKTLALVRRGDISFSEKVQNAMNADAAGVIIYNNLSGEIRMSLAEIEDPVPTCSIGLNEGTAMVNNAVGSVGKITFSKEFTAGPFMSSFSSWGVTPDLKLKPEITAHGGEIMSAVPGGYDTYSGTSMAAPNMAGAAALLRQHVKTKYPDLTSVELNARVNQLLMSTATIARNPVGNPYSPRKQGAGLANIRNAINTQAYITVPDKNGNALDKTKIEFSDDPSRLGVYNAKFTIVNDSDAQASYDLTAYVFTETLAINKRTVEENAYMFAPSDATYKINGSPVSSVTVAAGESAEVEVTVTLTASDKKYLDESFENGMYVEGYFVLKNKNAEFTDLSVPFLAFYGDWADAPLFDYSIYELAVTDADKSIEESKKPKASARETTPLGLYNDGQYIMPLGSYLYEQNEDEVEIFPSSDKAAISMYDNSNRRTIYQLYMIYGGLLRGAKTMHITITDAVTGELVYDKTEHNVRKAYANGGANVGSPITIEMNPYEWGLSNNREYIFKMQGTLDWDKDNGKANKDTFEFTFHVDYEAPSIESYSVRFEPYTENKETKYRIYLDVNVYDNQYVSSLLPCYVKGNTLYLMTEYVIPVNSERNSVTQVSFEITDFYDEYKNDIYLGVEDYAMNQSLYHLNLTNATKYCNQLKFEETDDLIQTGTRTGTTTVNGEVIRNEYAVYSLALAPNEAVSLSAITDSDDTYSYKLDWSTGNSSVAVAYENQIFAKKAGKTTISVKDGNGVTKAQIAVTVSGDAVRRASPETLSFRPVINADNNIQALPNGTTLELYPNTKVKFNVDADPWYLTDELEYEWISSDESVLSVDQNGNIVTHKKGIAYVTVSAKGYNRVSTSVRVSVINAFKISNYTLYEYHGGPEVDIPDELNVMYIDEDAFKGNKEITKLILPKTLTEIPERAFQNCTGLKEITIPYQTNVIGKNAFENCTSLETIYLNKFIDEDRPNEEMTGAVTVANEAFKGCVSLKNIDNCQRLTTVGRESFAGCTSLKTIDLSGLAVSYDRAFAGCTGLKNLIMSEYTDPATNMFAGCTSLETVTYPMNYVADGMFAGCVNLADITFTGNLTYIGANAFEGAAISSVTVSDGNVTIGQNAFKDCKNLVSFDIGADARVSFDGIRPFEGCDVFTAFTVAADNAYHSAANGILFNKSKTAISVIPEGLTDVTIPSGVTEIGSNVFSGKTNLESVTLGGITKIGDYAFAETSLKSIVVPASVTSIGKGAFYGCNLLGSVTFENGSVISELSDETFYGCTSLVAVDLPVSVKTIGANAFRNSAVTRVGFGSAVSIGANAFRNSKLIAADLPSSVTSIDAYAFAEIPSLQSVRIPAVTSMGEFAFANAPRLTSVVFADGATLIGDYAFAWVGMTGQSMLSDVKLSATVESVGEGAFVGSTALKSIDLTHVDNISDFAFEGSGLTLLDTSAKTIGARAFADVKTLLSAKADSAEYIGEQAFYNTGITSLSITSVKALGANAFTNTRLTTVEIPASLASYSYEQTLLLYAPSSGKYEEKKIGTESVGYGAFSDIPTLTSITVAAGNPVFGSRDGVLYAKVNNGITLVQYPTAKADKEYTVENGTVRIEADAFVNVKNLEKVTIPAGVKSIGARAFYRSSVKQYVFGGVEAPILDTMYVSANSFAANDILRTIFATTSNLELGSQVFYANFFDYVAKIVEERRLNEAGTRYKAQPFGLKITYPENGVGYDNLIWSAFFDDKELSAYAPADVTLRTINAIAAIPMNSIESATSIAEINDISTNYVAVSRALYNTVNDAKQRAFIDGDKLVKAESAVRAARARLGSPAKVVSLKITEPDQQKYYDGETINTAGLIVTAVYDDTSEEQVTGYTLSKTTMSLDDKEVIVTYNGVQGKFDVSVTVKVEYVVKFTGEFVKEFDVTAIGGRPVAEPNAPKKSGYAFDGWYDGDVEYDFSKNVTGDITLTAHWTKVEGESNVGAIVGIVVAVALVAGCAAAVGCFIAARKKKAVLAAASVSESVSSESETDAADSVISANAESTAADTEPISAESEEPTVENNADGAEVSETEQTPDAEKAADAKTDDANVGTKKKTSRKSGGNKKS